MKKQNSYSQPLIKITGSPSVATLLPYPSALQTPIRGMSMADFKSPTVPVKYLYRRAVKRLQQSRQDSQ